MTDWVRAADTGSVAPGGRSIFKRFALLILLIAAFISLAQGLRNAYRFSNDLQWSGTRLLVNHIDPYKVYLTGDPSHSLMQWQIPNYLHELYILELPLGYLSFRTASCIWAAANLVFITLSFVILIRFYKLSQTTAATFVLLVLCSTAFRNSLGNGQQDILATLSFIATMCLASSYKRALGVAGILAKYNFAPVALGYLLGKRKFILLLAALAIAAGGYLAFLGFIYFQQPLQIAVEPFLVSRTGITPGKADLMTAIEQISFLSSNVVHLASYSIGMASAVAYGWLVSKSRLSPQAAAASMAAVTLVTVKHVDYDLLLLIVPLAYLITKGNYAVFLSLLCIGELFYLDRWLPVASYLPGSILRLIYMAMILVIIVSIHYTDLHATPAPPEPPSIAQPNASV